MDKIALPPPGAVVENIPDIREVFFTLGFDETANHDQSNASHQGYRVDQNQDHLGAPAHATLQRLTPLVSLLCRIFWLRQSRNKVHEILGI